MDFPSHTHGSRQHNDNRKENSLKTSKPHVFQPVCSPSSAELSCLYLHPTAAALVVVPAGNEKCAHGISISPPGGESLSSHHTVLPDQWMMGNSKRGKQATCKPRASGTSTGAQSGSAEFCFGMILFLYVFHWSSSYAQRNHLCCNLFNFSTK